MSFFTLFFEGMKKTQKKITNHHFQFDAEGGKEMGKKRKENNKPPFISSSSPRKDLDPIQIPVFHPELISSKGTNPRF
jgi:hypothetical protein